MSEWYPEDSGFSKKIVWFFLSNKLVVFLFLSLILFLGFIYAPFDWDTELIERFPIPADAIPDIGENQQIVFTEWAGRSPQDVEDQISYPLTVSLLGISKVKSIRSKSMFGFSIIFIIFDDDADFYWARTRILEKLASLPSNVLPPEVSPTLGPDATPLGQVFWYTLEGQDEKGNPIGGWDLNELRSVQDWNVRLALQAAEGVSEVASVGGFVREYQIDLDPEAMRVHGVSFEDVFRAVTQSNIDVGASSIEINKVEYFIRGIGFIKKIDDLSEAVVKSNNNIPLKIKDIATVGTGPALRRGALDKAGAETVGGVVTVRYGSNPLRTIKNVKKIIERISPSLPSKAVIDWNLVTQHGVAKFAEERGFKAFHEDGSLNQDEWLAYLKKNAPEKRPEWIKLSQVRIVPFYDRTELIHQTLRTLSNSLELQLIVTAIVIIALLGIIRSALVVSFVMPVSIALCFIFMKIFGIEANVVALSGIAMAIGTVVDMGIIVSENILRRLSETKGCENRIKIIYEAAAEEASAVLTAISTTVVSFMLVFALESSEGKLFRPLAFTYIFVLASSLIVALTIVPAFAHILMPNAKISNKRFRPLLWLVFLIFIAFLSTEWLPLGAGKGFFPNVIFTIVIILFFLGIFGLFKKFYIQILATCLDHKLIFSLLPISIYVLGLVCWFGFGKIFDFLPSSIKQTAFYSKLYHAFPGLGKEFMPPLDEGSFLFMPTTMPHAGISEALDVLQKQDKLIMTIPEIESAVGKLGRTNSPLDPAPPEMFETVINYKAEFICDSSGKRLTFKYLPEENDFFRDEFGKPVNAPDNLPYIVRGKFERTYDGKLIPDKNGVPFRLWRPALDPSLNAGRTAWQGIKTPDDIWKEIVKRTEIPGTTSAPRLQPISARIVMLQSGMRAPIGVKVKGDNLNDLEKASLQIEKVLREVPSVEKSTVIADRIIGKPYIEIEIDREALARYNLTVAKVQELVELAIGGRQLSSSVEKRERYPIRIRFKRELRDTPEAIGKLVVSAENGLQIPLAQLSKINFKKGPQEIKSEDGFLVNYVLFDKKAEVAEVDVVEECEKLLSDKIDKGELNIPRGVSYQFAGTYQSQLRAEKKLRIILPISLLAIFLILYLQFREIATSFLVFIDIASSWAAGFIALWLVSQPWFLDFHFFGVNPREVFHLGQINLSVAVWVGFLALFGIATDDGVVLCTFMNEKLREKMPKSICEIRKAVLEGSSCRIRACLMTTATTVIALLPIFTSAGRGADIMRPMAMPIFAGMLMAIITPVFVPVFYCAIKELKFRIFSKCDRF